MRQALSRGGLVSLQRAIGSCSIGMVLSLVGTLFAQELPTFERPVWRAVEPFSNICGVRLLSDGRAIVCDATERTVVMLGSNGRREFSIGRWGGGPGEYQQPGGLLRMPGDTTWLVDRTLRRFLVIGPDGSLGRTVAFPPESQTVPVFRGTDRDGHVFFQPFWFPLEPGDGSRVPILRWFPGMESSDTIAHVLGPAPKVQVDGPSSARTNNFFVMPFTPQDDWGVFADGSVVVVRVEGYFLEIVESGGVIRRGPDVPFQAVRVTAADQRARGQGIVEYPKTKPPFPPGATRLDGERIWVLRNAPANAPTVPWDVFDRRGRRIETVSIARDLRVVAFGTRLVYAIRTDEDGLEWLEAFPRS